MAMRLSGVAVSAVAAIVGIPVIGVTVLLSENGNLSGFFVESKAVAATTLTTASYVGGSE